MQHFSQIVPRVCSTSVLFIVSNALLLPRHVFTLSKHAQLMAEGLHFSALSLTLGAHAPEGSGSCPVCVSVCVCVCPQP